MEGTEKLGTGEEGPGLWNALFRNCKRLRTVRVARGRAVKVRKFVGFLVRVRQK